MLDVRVMAIFGINWKRTQGALGDFNVLEMVEGLPGYDHFVKTHRVVHVWFVLLSVYEFPRSVGAQYATGDQWRNNSRKNE